MSRTGAGEDPCVLLRRELPEDQEPIRAVHSAAFGHPGDSGPPLEVGVVDKLRDSDAWLPALSLVALVDGAVAGHVVCSRATLEPSGHPALGLGPLGVLPEHQRQGVGSALMHAVLGAADALDEPLVVLLGHRSYYPRFGFVPATILEIEPPVADWGSSFQARRLSTYRRELRGRFRYASAFGID